MLLEVVFSSLKYQLLYHRLGIRIRFRDVVVLDVATASAGVVAPAKSELFVRAAYLAAEKYCSFTQALGTSFYNLFSNLLALVFFGFAGAVIIAAAFFLAPAAVRSYGPNRVRGDAAGLPRGWMQIWLFLLSFGRALSVPLLLAMLFHSFSINVPWFRLGFRGALVELASQLPITVAGTGLRESSLLFFFRASGSPGSLLVCGAVLTVVTRLLPAALGLPFFWRLMAAARLRSKEDKPGA